MINAGYEGIWEERPGRHDGSAILYKRSKVKVLRNKAIQFDDLCGLTDDDELKARLKCNNVGVVIEAELISGSSGPTSPPSQPFVVSTSHIHWDPRFVYLLLLLTFNEWSSVSCILPLKDT
jgi:hypothetical protein